MNSTREAKYRFGIVMLTIGAPLVIAFMVAFAFKPAWGYILQYPIILSGVISTAGAIIAAWYE